jgi:hypothetical protein
MVIVMMMHAVAITEYNPHSPRRRYIFSGPSVTKQEGERRLKPLVTLWAIVPNLQATTSRSQRWNLPTEPRLDSLRLGRNQSGVLVCLTTV